MEVRFPEVAAAPDASGRGMTVDASRRLLFYLLAASAFLLILWSFAVPVFESPDEAVHWQVARFINEHHRLPFYDSQMVEANQPPLYYALIAPVAGPTTYPASAMYRNPDGQNVSMFPPKISHNSPADFSRMWPIRAARLVTALLSVIGVWFCYLTGVEATGRKSTGLLAAGLMAFLPQFTFRGMSVSNDAFVTTTSAIAVYCIVTVMRRGYSRRMAVLTAVAIAAAFLSKVNAMFLAPMFAAALVSESAPWRVRLRRLGVFGISALIVLPWLIRNQALYGDPFANQAMFTAVPMLIDRKPISSPYFLTTFPSALFRSTVSVFGGMNVWLPDIFYRLYKAFAAIAMLGLCWALERRRISVRLAVILAIAPLIVVALVVKLNLTFTQPQGRYLFPALSTMAVLVAIGFESLPRWTSTATNILLVVAAFWNTAVLCAVILPTYWISPETTVLPTDVAVSELLMRTTTGPIRPGDELVQTFVSRADFLCAVEIEAATWSKRIPSGWLHMRLSQTGEEKVEVASWRVPLPQVRDNSFVRLEFPRIPNSRGKSYALAVSAEQVPPGYDVTVWLSDRDVYPAGYFSLNGRRQEGDAAIRTYVAPEIVGQAGVR